MEEDTGDIPSHRCVLRGPTPLQVGSWGSRGCPSSALTSELQVRVQLILELFPVDGGTTTAWRGIWGQQEPLAPGEGPRGVSGPVLTCTRGVPSLHHEILDDSVEFGAIVVPATAQLSKVLAGAGGVLPVQLQHQGTHPGNGSTGNANGNGNGKGTGNGEQRWEREKKTGSSQSDPHMPSSGPEPGAGVPEQLQHLQARPGNGNGRNGNRRSTGNGNWGHGHPTVNPKPSFSPKSGAVLLMGINGVNGN